MNSKIFLAGENSQILYHNLWTVMKNAFELVCAIILIVFFSVRRIGQERKHKNTAACVLIVVMYNDYKLHFDQILFQVFLNSDKCRFFEKESLFLPHPQVLITVS